MDLLGCFKNVTLENFHFRHFGHFLGQKMWEKCRKMSKMAIFGLWAPKKWQKWRKRKFPKVTFLKHPKRSNIVKNRFLGQKTWDPLKIWDICVLSSRRPNLQGNFVKTGQNPSFFQKSYIFLPKSDVFLQVLSKIHL